MQIADKEALRNAVRVALRKTEALDLWTNLPADPMSSDDRHGVDALISSQEGWLRQLRALDDALPEEPNARVDALFRALFVAHTPLNDASQRVLLTLERLGLPMHSKDLSALRDKIAQTDLCEQLQQALELAKLRGIACTLDPLAQDAGAMLEGINSGAISSKLLPVITIEALQHAVAQDVAVDTMGCHIEPDRYGAHIARISQVLAQWIEATGACMIRAAWPTMPFEQDALMRYAVLPLCEEGGLPLMLALSDQESEVADQLAWVQNVLMRSVSVRFVLVARSARSARLLMSCAQQFNERLFLVLATGRCMANEALGAMGTQIMPFASDATVVEQIIGDWIEARREIAQALYDRYLPLIKMGWSVQQEDIAADVEHMLGGNWERFCNYQCKAQ